MKQFFVGILILVSLVFAIQRPVFAQDGNNAFRVEIVAFVRVGCVHCADEERFLTELQTKRDDIRVAYYRLENADERHVWEEFTARVGISKVTPITVIGDAYIVGFDTKDTTGKEILARIDEAQKLSRSTNLSAITASGNKGTTRTCDESGLAPCTVEKPSMSISLPFIGSIDTGKYPLIALSALLGFFDGFNPCAMWVLVTFLIILLQVGDRKKMVVFAGTFIAAEAIMYSLILTVWYKTWDFIRLDSIVTPVVGVIAIAGGLFFLWEWRKKELECKVTDHQARHNTRKKIEELAAAEFTIMTFLAILGIAFSVNIIEFACSIGIPQAFTKILELNRLPWFSSGGLIAIYILFYMIDDLLVFGLALYGAEKLALTTKYSKLSNLIGGIVMILLGIFLLIRPSVLLF